MNIILRRIIDSITVDTFKEKATLIIEKLSMPTDHIHGIYSFIGQANYMIGKGRNKLSDEELRESFREQVEMDLDQLEKYGPLKRAKVENGKVILSHRK